MHWHVSSKPKPKPQRARHGGKVKECLLLTFSRTGRISDTLGRALESVLERIGKIRGSHAYDRPPTPHQNES